MRTLLPAMALGLIAALTSPSPLQATPTPETIDELVETRLAETGTPGAALTVVGPDGESTTAVFGVDGDGHPVTADTPFLWGSVAKPVTATLILRLIDTGQLTIDDDVATHLPWFKPTWQREPTTITVEQLLTHTAGLPEAQAGTATDRADGDTVTERARQLATIELTAEPGTAYIYSSVDYLLLGTVIESVTGQTFSDVLTGFTDEIGMTGVIADSSTADRRLPPGHVQFLGRPIPHQVAYDDSGVPYGYLAGDVGSLARFGQAHMDGTAASTAMLSRAHQHQVDSSGAGYGYGWSVGTVGDTNASMVWHSGAAPGYQAVLILLPDSGHVVALVQNTFGLARDAQLLNAGLDVAAQVSGTDRDTEYSVDEMFVVLPLVFIMIGIGFAATALLSLRQAKRRRVRWSIVVGVGVPAVSFIVLPMVAGVPLSFVALWLPDTWVGLWTISISAVVWALCRLIRRTRVPRTGHETSEIGS